MMSKLSQTVEVMKFIDMFNNDYTNKVFNREVKSYKFVDGMYELSFRVDYNVTRDIIIDHGRLHYKELPFKFKIYRNMLAWIQVGYRNSGSYLKTLKNFPKKISGSLRLTNCPDLVDFGDIESVDILELDDCGVSLDMLPKYIGTLRLTKTYVKNHLKEFPRSVKEKIRFIQYGCLYYGREEFDNFIEWITRDGWRSDYE